MKTTLETKELNELESSSGYAAHSYNILVHCYSMVACITEYQNLVVVAQKVQLGVVSRINIFFV